MIEFLPTEDGSLTCFNEESGELYHNSAGAYTEALQTYIEPSEAISKLQARHELHVLDACFGLGYNSFVLLERAIAARCKGTIRILGVELDAEIVKATSEIVKTEQLEPVKELLGQSVNLDFGTTKLPGNNGLEIEITLINDDLRKFLPATRNDSFDLIFHDPFTPRKVPELWTVDLFREYYRLLQKRQGELLTYSSAGPIRGGLEQSGFQVYNTTPVGKNVGGTLAAIAAEPIERKGVYALSDRERKKLHSKSGIPYRDDNFQRPRASILTIRSAEQSLHIAIQD